MQRRAHRAPRHDDPPDQLQPLRRRRDAAQRGQPRDVVAGLVEHLDHRRRDHLPDLRLPLAHAERRLTPSAPTNILFDGVYFHDWMSQARRARRVPADPRRRQRHDPQLHLQELRHRQRRPRRDRRPAPQAYGRRPAAEEHPAREQLLLPLRQPVHDPGRRLRELRPALQLDLRPDPASTTAPARHRHGLHRQHHPRQPAAPPRQGAPINWRYNVIQGGTCGPTDRTPPPASSTPTTTSTSPPAPPQSTPATPPATPPATSTARARPLGAAPDAGADEAG